MKLVMDLVVNHTSDEHPWFVESRVEPRRPRSATGTGGARRAPGMAAGDPGAEPTNWRSFFSGPAWELDEASGEYYLHLFSRKQPDLNWENPEVREAVYAMMRWWLDRGVDGFRMDVINMISKDPDAARRPRAAARRRSATARRTTSAARASTSSCRRCTARSSPAARRRAAHRRRDARRDRRGGACCSPIPARGEVDMVFQFEHVRLDQGATQVGRAPAPRCATSRRRFGRWQAGLAERGWNSLYWNNHDQPRVVSRFGDDGEHRVRVGEAASARCCTCTAGRRTSTRARSSG